MHLHRTPFFHKISQIKSEIKGLQSRLMKIQNLFNEEEELKNQYQHILKTGTDYANTLKIIIHDLEKKICFDFNCHQNKKDFRKSIDYHKSAIIACNIQFDDVIHQFKKESLDMMGTKRIMV